MKNLINYVKLEGDEFVSDLWTVDELRSMQCDTRFNTPPFVHSTSQDSSGECQDVHFLPCACCVGVIILGDVRSITFFTHQSCNLGHDKYDLCRTFTDQGDYPIVETGDVSTGDVANKVMQHPDWRLICNDTNVPEMGCE